MHINACSNNNNVRCTVRVTCWAGVKHERWRNGHCNRRQVVTGVMRVTSGIKINNVQQWSVFSTFVYDHNLIRLRYSDIRKVLSETLLHQLSAGNYGLLIIENCVLRLNMQTSCKLCNFCYRFPLRNTFHGRKKLKRFSKEILFFFFLRY